MKVFYWSPHIAHVATVTAVINSAAALKKYSQDNISITLLNSIGEWNTHKKEISKKKIDIIDLYIKEKFTNIPKYGFLKSRFSYWVIFFSSFFPLKKILKKNKPDFLIIHLLTSLPIILNFFFKFDTKIILRISGHPKLNIFRKFLWKHLGKGLTKIVCPTEQTKKFLVDNKIFEDKKIYVLKDPIISITKINIQKKETIEEKFLLKEKFILTIGRLTRQKNYFFLLDGFKEINKIYPKYKLVIIGDGENKNNLLRHVKNLGLDKTVYFFSFKSNVFKYLYRCSCFILTSLWEDPGFVIAEAISVNKPVISSNCPNGPEEFISNGKGGFLFKSNNLKDLVKVFVEFEKSNKDTIKKKIITSKKVIKNYTSFRHYLELKKNILYE